MLSFGECTRETEIQNALIIEIFGAVETKTFPVFFLGGGVAEQKILDDQNLYLNQNLYLGQNLYIP
jgi:hypothetical protein